MSVASGATEPAAQSPQYEPGPQAPPNAAISEPPGRTAFPDPHGALTRSDLLSLLGKAMDEEHSFLEAHQHRVAFYTSIASAIVAATVAGALQAKSASHFVLLLVGPLLIGGLCHIGREGTFRFYQRFLEAVTIRAKLEQAVGLTITFSDSPGNAGYWQSEALVAPRHLSARCESESSAEFIQGRLRTGYQRSTNQMFTLFQSVALVLSGALILLALNR